ncbi:MFS transporter [Estrella lausannensis]|uniref:Major facilitator family transporter n=1 Tax=Estrella lausannensis TaxID=483423 RepID=A0A0H5E3Y5_9BACT|nr:MFS transporter [Estrella lausannensis]CRX37925.1 Major facilitator family transporter [Estrella lausannensis]
MPDKDKRQFWTVLFIVFMGFLGISMPYLIFPALFLNPAYSIVSDYTIAPSLLLGMTLAAYPLGQFIGSPILGALSDDYGRKRLLAGTLFLNAFFNLLTAFALKWHLVELLILSRLLSGFMEGNIAIARAMAMFPSIKPESQVDAEALHLWEDQRVCVDCLFNRPLFWRDLNRQQSL